MTPQLGKRKRGSKDAQTLDQDDGEPDELSPDQNNGTNSIERPRTVVVADVSPVHEELDEGPDELTLVLEGAVDLRKNVADAAVDPIAAEKMPVSVRRARGRTQSRSGTKRKSMPSRLSTGASPEIDGNGSSEGEEDELTPALASVTPEVIGEQSPTRSIAQDDIDELSSPAQSAAVSSIQSPTVSGKRLPIRGNGILSTPAAAKGRRKKSSLDAQEGANPEDSPDELSPITSRTLDSFARREPNAQAMHAQEDAVEPWPAGEKSVHVDAEEHEDEPTLRILPATKQKPIKNGKGRAPPARRKASGPRQAISVMRIKGSTVSGVTVADTTRTILEESIDERAQRMASKLETAGDGSRRKMLRGQINLALAFKESLVERLMDLQDANDTLSAGFKKRKLLRKENVERRREMLAMQNRRHEYALEMDDERAVYDAAKERAEARSKLSANMFDIQAAVQSGRERARREGREHEGPERPLSMLVDTMGRKVGSVGGGLLATVQRFNRGLEKAAGWLEGRA